MKKLIQLTLATVFVVITVLTVNINKADAVGDYFECELRPMQECSGIGTQGKPIFVFAQDKAPFQEGATVEVRGGCDLRIHLPPHGLSREMCTTQSGVPGGPYTITNYGPDSVRVGAVSGE